MSDAVDETSPWERDDVPVRTQPLAIEWDTPGVDTDPRPHDEPAGAKPWPWIAGLGLGALIVGAAMVALPDSDDETADEPPPTLDALPVVESTARREDDELRLAETRAAEVAAAAELLLEAENAEPVPFGEGLPPAVAAIDTPTEIVLRSADGLFHTLSLPSGTIRTIDIGTTDGFGSIVTSPDASMIGTFERGPIIISREGIPIELDPADFETTSMSAGGGQVYPYGYVDNEDGSTSFVVTVWDSGIEGRREYLVDSDGSVRRDPVTRMLSDVVRVWGTRIVEDAGGVYRVDGDEATRISPGRVMGSSRTAMLIRTCDDALACSASVVDFDGENSRDVELPAGLPQASGLSLSPDGSAVTYTSYADSQAEQVVLGFDGTSTRFPVFSGPGGSEWTHDGSGLFTVTREGELGYVDLSAPEPTPVKFGGEAFGQVTAIGVRFPDDELADTAPTSTTGFILSRQPASAIDLHIVVVSRPATVSAIDLDELTAMAWTTPRVPGTTTPRIFDVGDEFIVVSGTGNIVFSGTPGDMVDISDDIGLGPPFAAGPDGLGIWARVPDALAPVDQAVMTPTAPGSLGEIAPTLSAPDGLILGDDGAGSLVFESGGDVYTSDGTTTTRLTTGDLLALSPDAALIRECDAPTACDEFLVDRSTGQRTEDDGGLIATASAADADRDVTLVGTLSPDGATALVPVQALDDKGGLATVWSMVDLVTEEAARIRTPDDDQPIVWNADSSYAAFVSEGQLSVYEVATGSVISVLLPGEVRAIAPTDTGLSTG